MMKENTKRDKLILFIFSAVVIILLLNMIVWFSLGIFKDYKYEKLKASNGVELHVLQTDPNYISFKTINENVSEAELIGINGGFFYESFLLSIAVEDGTPANGEVNKYGSGWFNEKYARGTLVFDKVTNKFAIQVVKSTDEINITDRSKYWAHGGVSMSLQNEEHWKERKEEEALPYPDGQHLRSGLVFDREGNVYLIVSSTKSTADLFRDAVLEKVAVGVLVDGIFLDGDGSSQLYSDEVKLAGDSRDVVQMIVISNKD
ncbi:phosphodiester glycosidase family protein [Chengkuizengella axinellae]|uniref:Phosphodiester glycosidase family protein n=1 Tax=Chengkuizengella axinellae TaxID=3064388 RepID=A0ABT9IXP0_9BACL|nr:phosphodiester glycosidase family protein [Chengkuizengella sp. 2205SS18-9]MDP5274135.1 phosphodiester glycosidase family protein [Chengkuizengella sp. 2205SS18-9]